MSCSPCVMLPPFKHGGPLASTSETGLTSRWCAVAGGGDGSLVAVSRRPPRGVVAASEDVRGVSVPHAHEQNARKAVLGDEGEPPRWIASGYRCMQASC